MKVDTDVQESCSTFISYESLIPFFLFVFRTTALETLVESRISGFPVVDDDGKLVSFLHLKSSAFNGRLSRLE